LGGRGVRDESTEEAPGDDLERHLTGAPRFVVQCKPQLWECRVVPGPEKSAHAPYAQPIGVRAGLFVEELLGAWATEGEQELGIHRLAAYQPSAARDDLLLATAAAFALNALPRRHAPP
jgi:hypothetical protein